jgi:hypothetical protein
MTLFYYLDKDDTIVPVDDFNNPEWLCFMKDIARRRLATDVVSDGIKVSTVFLGIDHGHGAPGNVPVLWETLVFGGPLDGEMRRYTSKEEALKGHEDMLRLVRTGADPDADVR